MPAAKPAKVKTAKNYQHTGAEAPMRPEAGTQAQFKKRLPAQKYRYDDSLAPELRWDGQNAKARDKGEELLRAVMSASTLQEAKAAAAELKAMSGAFLNWAGKAERTSFDVPTLPLFIHERLSTKAILETLKGHARDKQTDMFELFGDPGHSIADQVLRAYEHRDQWVNRMVLGDSMVVMNSLLRYEGMGGQVQMIYIDPPYGVKFGSNFQPFVRKRDVSHNDDEDMTREPEMVQAYRDTWELGLHSYLTYLRDRLLVARELLTASGSVFVQISDENVHHVRELMDEVFGAENFVSLIAFRKTSNLTAEYLPTSSDFILWYGKDRQLTKYNQIYVEKTFDNLNSDSFGCAELPDGSWRRLTQSEKMAPANLPADWRLFGLSDLTSSHFYNSPPFEYQGRQFAPKNRYWSTSVQGLKRLAEESRLAIVGDTLRYKRFISDFPVTLLNNIWHDTGTGTQTEERSYVVQTSSKVVQRCLLMTTDPGDLVLDPTCGSGTTAYVAEQWGRRWITCDTSRVPLALARQRLLTATFDWYELKDEGRGPASGFEYKRRQNNKGEEVGGIVPHVTLKSIANNEPAAEEVLVDRPEVKRNVTRVSGPFCFEATIPTPMDWEPPHRTSSGGGPEELAKAVGEDADPPGGRPAPQVHTQFVERMIEVLRRSPVLRLEGNQVVVLKNVRPPAKSLSLSAEAMVDATAPGMAATLDQAVMEAAEKSGGALPLSQKPVAFVFGPENGAVSERLVYQAAKEASAKSYSHLYVIGFGIEPNARALVEHCEAMFGITASYVQATPDLMMGDLLKNMRSSQIFSVCGLPEVKLRRVKGKVGEDADPPIGDMYSVELVGMDVFDPITMKSDGKAGNDVPAWFLDTDYNGMCFHVSQAFFPRTSAWENLRKALKGEYEESVWDHLAGTVSAPFAAGEHRQVAVKVIDDRGNELMVVKGLAADGRG